jgi:hypothetical protein
MTQIILSDEQTRLLSGASFPIVILDSRGRKVTEIPSIEPTQVDVQSMSDEDWVAEALRRRDESRRDGGKGFTTQEVLTHLRALKPE